MAGPDPLFDVLEHGGEGRAVERGHFRGGERGVVEDLVGDVGEVQEVCEVVGVHAGGRFVGVGWGVGGEVCLLALEAEGGERHQISHGSYLRKF